MTIVTINLSDVAYGTPDSTVSFAAPRIRENTGQEGAGVVTLTDPVTPTLTDGVGEIKLKPGPVIVKLGDRFARTCNVPEDVAIMSLADLLRPTLPPSPVMLTDLEALLAAVKAERERFEALQGGTPTEGDPGDGAGSGDVLWSEINPILDGKASVSHVHTIAQVSGLQDELDGKASAASILTEDPAGSGLYTIPTTAGA